MHFRLFNLIPLLKRQQLSQSIYLFNFSNIIFNSQFTPAIEIPDSYSQFAVWADDWLNWTFITSYFPWLMLIRGSAIRNNRTESTVNNNHHPINRYMDILHLFHSEIDWCCLLSFEVWITTQCNAREKYAAIKYPISIVWTWSNHSKIEWNVPCSFSSSLASYGVRSLKKGGEISLFYHLSSI